MSKYSSYTYHGTTPSGWKVSTDPAADSDKRWRIVHPYFGEQFFASHDDIGRFTAMHLMKWMQARGQLDGIHLHTSAK